MGVKTKKRRKFAGAVCEQIVYNVPDGVRNPENYDPERVKKDRFKDKEAYIKFKEDISRRTHAANFNAAFGPGDIGKYILSRMPRGFGITSSEHCDGNIRML